MLDPSRPIFIWTIWPYLSSLEKLLFIALIVLGVYVLFTAIITISGVLKARALRSGVSFDAQTLIALRNRSTRVDRLIMSAFYLFGGILFWGLQGAYFTIIDGKASAVESGILRDFEPHFAFAANAFFAFFILYAIAWFVSSRVSRLALRAIP